jgi:hypothetical protein
MTMLMTVMKMILDFYFPIYLILPAVLYPGDLLSLWQGRVLEIFLEVQAWRACKADNLTGICEPIV